jgi:hypothetical protein
MPEKKLNFTLSGWHALVGIVVIVLFLGGRIVTMDDMSNNKKLMKEVEFELMTEYFPDDVNKMKSLFESGNTDEFNRALESTLSTKMNVKSVKASYSIFDFSTKDRDVVVKVAYSLEDAYGTRKKETKYYLFEHKPVINGWRCRGETFKWRYYSNFI